MAGRQRLTLTALFGTLAALLTVASRAETATLARSGIQLSTVQITYGILIGLLILMLPFVSRFRIPGWGIGLAGLASFYAVWHINPVQEARLFEMPFSLWVIVVHAVGMSLLAGLFMSDTATEKWLARAVNISIAGFGLVLMGLYIASTGEFMALDMPDEPWLASMATNFALHNDLSPSFIGAPYGSPDPVLPRYYLLMGLWLKLAGTSLAAMRLFPLLVGLAGAVLFGWLLANTRLQGRDMRRFYRLEEDGFELAGLTLPRETKSNRRTGVLLGVVVLLGTSAYLRMSHNLRMDIGLGIYGVVMLFGLLHIFDEQPGRWPGFMGLALLVGLETVPSIGLVLGGAAGLVLAIRAIQQPQERLSAVVFYGLACAVSAGLYLALHFLPDVQSSLAGYHQFSAVYTAQNPIGQLRFPIDDLLNYHLRFSLILAPVELLICMGALAGLWFWGSRAERWMLVTFGLVLIVGLMLVDVSYGYWVLFAPLVAYAMARVFHHLPTVIVFILLPAFLAAPIHDLAAAATQMPNHRLLAETQAVAAQIPRGGRIVGDPLFWYTMQADWDYMGWIATEYPMQINHLSPAQSLIALRPDAAICLQLENCQQAWDSGLFSFPVEVVVNSRSYLIFLRENLENKP
ncbi:MAG: hypothetical protein K8L97_18110 [Anaerolineae bacterium]|nr:hypothetical protein [Anaerolineae bacterium]